MHLALMSLGVLLLVASALRCFGATWKEAYGMVVELAALTAAIVAFKVMVVAMMITVGITLPPEWRIFPQRQ